MTIKQRIGCFLILFGLIGIIAPQAEAELGKIKRRKLRAADRRWAASLEAQIFTYGLTADQAEECDINIWIEYYQAGKLAGKKSLFQLTNYQLNKQTNDLRIGLINSTLPERSKAEWLISFAEAAGCQYCNFNCLTWQSIIEEEPIEANREIIIAIGGKKNLDCEQITELIKEGSTYLLKLKIERS